MEKKRLTGALAALAGMIFLFFPVIGGEDSCSAIRLIGGWWSGQRLCAVWMAAVVLLIMAAVLLLINGREGKSVTYATVVSAAAIASLFMLPCIYRGKLMMPGWGGLGAAVCMLLSIFLARGAKAEKGEAPEIPAMPDTGEMRPDRATQKAGAGPEHENAADGRPGPESRGGQRETAGPDGRDDVKRAAAPEAVKPESAVRTAETAETSKTSGPARQEAAVPPPVQGEVYVFCGGFDGAAIPLGHMESVTIGRDAENCNLVIDDAAMSRKHCTVTYNAVNNTYLLLDTSSNGTYLEGGQKIPRNYAMEVQPGLRFYLGRPENAFRLGREYK